MQFDKCTVLFVEDNRETQEQMRLLLEDDVKTFYQAYDGEEGYALFREKRPDIVLTDIAMPKLDGLAMARKIKGESPTQTIVVLSAFDDRGTLLEAINIGIDGFIPKPVDVDTVYSHLQKVSQHLKKAKAHEQAVLSETKKLHTLAYRDSLTSLMNRFAFHTELDKAIENAAPDKQTLALFFIDLDDFKSVNDRFSHSAGDAVLQTVARRISSLLSDNERFARISGDEFMLLVENVRSRRQLETLAAAVIDTLRQPVTFNGETIPVGCSIGIALFPDDAVQKDALVHASDQAMYRAKNAGKHRYAFTDTPGSEP